MMILNYPARPSVILRMLIKGKQRVDVIRKMEAEVGVM
jgi:hypothetical protein